MDRNEWVQMRRLFDAVCELSPDQWHERLMTLTDDPELVEQTLGLLRSQTLQLRQASESIDALLGRLSVVTELGVGDRLEKWRLVDRIGGGGMGTVFLATRADEMYEQKVAIKLLHGLPSNAVARQLAAERKILAGLQHPSIARLYDGGQTPDGQPYLVMEYVEGTRLDDHCMLGREDLRSRLRLFVKICRAVQSAHAKLVIHCDLKPGNVLVSDSGEPMLLDFGIARLVGGGEDDRGGFCTPGYASPELVSGREVDVASDIFSLGVILTEMIACRPLQRGLEDVSRPVPPPSTVAVEDCPWTRRLRGDLDAIVAKACALEPAARYATVEALADDVERHLSGFAVRARGGSRLYRARRLARRSWRELAAVATLAAVSLGFMAWLLEANAKAEREAAMAREISDFLVSSFEAANPRTRGLRGDGEVSARELLDASVSRMDEQLANAPVQLARMRAVIGAAYQNIGMPQQAEAMLRQAVEGFLSPQVDDPVMASRTLSDLATELANAARGQESLEAAQQALSLLEGHSFVDEERAIALNSLGLAMAQLERYGEAEDAYRQSMDLRRSLASDGTPGGIPTVIHNMGLMFRSSGDLERAEAAFREAVALKREQNRSRYDYRSSLLALAGTLAQRGELREALRMSEESLALAIEIAGKRSVLVGDSYNELASIHQDLGEYDRSADYYAKALALIGALEGEDSVSYAITLNNFATLEEARGDLAAAEPLYRRSWQIRRDALEVDAPPVLRAEANLGRLLTRMGRLDEAKPLIERPLAVWSERLDPSVPNLLRANLGLAEWRLRAEQLESAAALLEAQRSHAEQAPRAIGVIHRSLSAELAQRSGNMARAVSRWRALVDDALEHDGPDSMLVAKSRVALAECLLMIGARDEARREVEAASAPLHSRLVPEAEALQRLQRLQRLLGEGAPRTALLP